MASEVQTVPTPDEVRTQLDHMLKSKRFIANENPARFLAFVVEKALKNESITQAIIGLELFPKKYARSDISDVRVTAINLRRVLAKYYEHEGREDPVIISFTPPPRDNEIKLPAGKPYQPLFGYNPLSTAQQDYSRGVLYLKQLTEIGIRSALGSFSAVVKAAPGHAAAYAGMAEAYCIFAIYDQPAKNSLLLAQDAAAKAVQLDPASWRGHAALGLVHSCMREWEKAGACYAVALECNASATEAYPWYSFYLLAMGKSDDALKFAKTKADTHPENIDTQLIYALVLYAARQYEAADRLLVPLLRLQQYHLDWRLLLLKILVGLQHDGWPDLPSLNDALMNSVKAHPFHRWKNIALGVSVQVYVNRILFSTTVMGAHSLAESFADMASKDLAQLQPSNEAFPLALAYVGLPEPERAIAELERCCDDCHPLMAWLHLCPLFDPLRDSEKFQALLSRMHLPSGLPTTAR